MEFDISYYYLFCLVLFIIGIAAGTVDAIAGGGGLISLPALLAVGVPPEVALGTNKFQTTIGTSMATFTYYRQGWLSFKTLFKGLIFGLLGAISGAVVGQLLDSDILRHTIPVLLLIMLVYTIVSPKFGEEDNKAKVGEFWFYVFFGFVLGFYDGFFGPGTGSLWLFSLTFFLGYNLIKASAFTKAFNLNSNFVATICFAIGSNIDYQIALCMAAGQLIGGRVGALLAIKNGPLIIRPLFVLIVSVTIISLFFRGCHKNISIFVTQLNFATFFIFLNIIILSSVSFYFLFKKKTRKMLGK